MMNTTNKEIAATLAEIRGEMESIRKENESALVELEAKLKPVIDLHTTASLGAKFVLWVLTASAALGASAAAFLQIRGD